jgi:hypothetical protein
MKENTLRAGSTLEVLNFYQVGNELETFLQKGQSHRAVRAISCRVRLA